MGHDRKLGVVTTERGDIPREEPVFVIRGKLRPGKKVHAERVDVPDLGVPDNELKGTAR